MITNKWLLGNEDVHVPLAIRKEIFDIDAFPYEKEENEIIDKQAMHLILLDDKAPVAIGKLYHDGQTFCIGSCCVRKDVRKQGVGDLLIKLLMLKAFSFNPSKIVVHAPKETKVFYERFGFCEQEGNADGDSHITMYVTKETMVFLSKCGHKKGYSDYFPTTDKTT